MVAPAVASAAARVRLRVEGQNATIFTGNVTTAQTVITDSVGATHTLDGKALCALDEAARLGAFTYVVKDFGFGIYVSNIAGENEVLIPPYPGWLYRVNMTSPSVGADTYEPADGDEILYYYGTYDASPTSVQLSSSTLAVGTTLTVTAMQHDMGGSPSVLPEAVIHIGSTTATADANGVAALKLSRVGTYGVRAEKEGPYIRSALRYARALYRSTLVGFAVGPTPVRPLRTIVARGRLVSNGAALRGRLVRLERSASASGPWQVVRVTATRPDGTFAVAVAAGRTAFYRARFLGDVTHLPAVSASRRVVVIR
jgi:hypothetical protein